MRAEWSIIGGGVHGVHAAICLVSAGIPVDEIKIIDPGGTLLARWMACTEATGMTYLRSPAVHHLGVSPWSLKHFAHDLLGRQACKGYFAPPYERPSLELFNAHAMALIEQHRLSDCHLQRRAEHIELEDAHARVTLDGGETLRAKHVVLALGASEQPSIPEWVHAHRRVQHVFSRDFAFPAIGEGSRVAVIGGGISAGQVASRCHALGATVDVFARHMPRVHQFDSDPGWLGPKYMSAFERERDIERRRKMIGRARYRGSLPPDVMRALEAGMRGGGVVWHLDEVLGMTTQEERVQLITATARHTFDEVMLATGFSTLRPGGALLSSLSRELSCARCGYPLTDHLLRWHPRVFLTGPLAELELGPTARNISGARRAGERLMRYVQIERLAR